MNILDRKLSTEWLFIHCSKIILEFRSVGFCRGRNLRTQKKKVQSKDKNLQVQPKHEMRSAINEPGKHWWELKVKADLTTTTPDSFSHELIPELHCQYAFSEVKPNDLVII